MNKRIEWIDIARGIGIILVVLGHSVTTVVRQNSSLAMDIYNAVYYVQVPLLLFISGLSFELSYGRYAKQSFIKYIKSKSTRLMLPYVSYSFLVYLIFLAAHQLPKISEILNDISYGKISIARWMINLLIGNNIYSEHLWYLYSLFVLSLTSFVLIKLVGKNYKYIILIITIFMWCFFKSATDYDVIWKTSLRGIWFALGCFSGVKENYSKTKRLIILLGVIVSYIIKYFFLGMIHKTRVIDAITIVIILSYLYGFVVVSQILEELGDTKLKWLGKNSMCIYIFHQPFWGSGLGVLLYKFFNVPIVVVVIVAFMACIIVPILIDATLRMPKLKIVRFMLLGE